MPWLLAAAFVLSGATSLILQVVWVRQLIDVFGSSTLAISTVLATFMAGLALGAWLGGRLADRLDSTRPTVLRDPVFYYAAAEALVAACALLIPLVVGNYHGANAWLWGKLGDTPVALSLARFALAAAVLLVPTTCMGATLPLLGRRLTTTEGDLAALGTRIGILYAANTAGAVAGAAAAGFYLIPLLGVGTTNRIAAIVAFALASSIAGALVWRARARDRRPGDGERANDTSSLSLTDSETTPTPLNLPRPARRLAVAAFAVSGAVAMALEVLWSRTMALVIGSSVYSFSLVLVVFLVGIAAGAALVARRAADTRDPLTLLAGVFIGVAASVLLTHAVADDLPHLLVALMRSSDLDVGALLTAHTLITGALILPTSLCLGAVMPLVIRAYASNLDTVGRDIGRAYAANTVGAIVGAFAGGFVILPLIGLENGVRGAALIDAGLGAVLLWRSTAKMRQRRLMATLAGTIALITLISPGWNTSLLTSGVFRLQVAKDYLDGDEIYQQKVLFYEDGVATTVTVEQRRGRPVLKNNGKIEASTVFDMPTQVLVGLLPVLLHPAAEQEVFVVGYGSGITVGAIAEAPSVTRVDVVELEPEVYRAADAHFGPYNHAPDKNPRVHRFVGDGRNFLLAGNRTYDIIVSEPSNPWIAGIASLFTREFFAFAKAHLSPHGLFCQWAQLYELGPRNVKMIYRTFHEAFPYVYAFTPSSYSSDTILIGSLEPLSFDYEVLSARMSEPAMRDELARGGIDQVEELFANLILGPSEVAAFSAGAPVNTDDNALLEYSAPADLLNALAERGAVRLAATIFSDLWPYGRLDDIVTGLGDGRTRSQRELAIARALLNNGRRREAARWADRAAATLGNEAAGFLQLLALAQVRDFADPEIAITAGSDQTMPPPRPELFQHADEARRQQAAAALRDAYGLAAAARWRDAWGAVRVLPPATDTDEGRDVRLFRGYLAYKALDLGIASRLLKPLLSAERAARRPAALYYAGRVEFGRGAFERGVTLLEAFRTRAPRAASDYLTRYE